MIVCAGSGGVGKTTMASAIAVRASQIGLRTLVLTVDPAKRLATALGLDLNDIVDCPVGLSSQLGEANVGGSLSAAVIDSKKIFDQFIRVHSQSNEITERIMRNRLYQQLSTTLAGSQEFTALERLLQSVESGKYDLVVLDTPPTKHAMDFLTAPERINALFQDAITKWFMGSGDRAPGFLAALVSKGTRTVLKSLEVLTGGPFIEELIDFFSAMRGIQKILRERSQRVEVLLKNKQTRFLVVTSFDAAKLQEAKYLDTQLKNLGYHLQGVIINRAFPIWMPAPFDEARERSPNYEKVWNFYSQFKEYYSIRYSLYERFAATLDKSVVLMRIPEYQQDIHGIDDLEKLAGVLAEL